MALTAHPRSLGGLVPCQSLASPWLSSGKLQDECCLQAEIKPEANTRRVPTWITRSGGGGDISQSHLPFSLPATWSAELQDVSRQI